MLFTTSAALMSCDSVSTLNPVSMTSQPVMASAWRMPPVVPISVMVKLTRCPAVGAGVSVVRST